MELREVENAWTLLRTRNAICIGRRPVMEAALEVMEAQLKVWGTKIDKLAAKTLKAGARARFEDLTHIDELKALHAIAHSKLTEFKAATGTKRARLKAELKSAWDDLNAAFTDPMP
jgi:hypothetical protein